MVEVWRDINGYEGLYQVSNLGNVRSLNWGNTGVVRNLYLKPHRKGYLQVELHKNAKRRMFTVHRLVATHFVQGFAIDRVVNHINEIKTDNRAENLEWVSYSYNNLYSWRNRQRNLSSSPPVIQYSMQGEVIKVWDSPIDVKHSLRYSDWSIRECCRGKRKQAYGYRWQFAI